MIESNATNFCTVYVKSNDKENWNSLNQVKSTDSNNKNNDKITALIKQIYRQEVSLGVSKYMFLDSFN